MWKVSDWGQDWLWTTETQWNQTLDLGLISNRIKPIELIVYRHFALNNLQLKRGRPESEKKYIMILMVTSVKEEARPLYMHFHPFHRVCYVRCGNSKASHTACGEEGCWCEQGEPVWVFVFL